MRLKWAHIGPKVGVQDELWRNVNYVMSWWADIPVTDHVGPMPDDRDFSL